MLKKFFLMLMAALFAMSFVSCETDGDDPGDTYTEFLLQTDWSGGDGQETAADSTMFLQSSGIDHTTVPGQLTLTGDYYASNDACSFNGKLYVSVTGYGTFEYDPGTDKWEISIAGHYWRYSHVYDGKLYTLYSGVNIYTYDGTDTDYGLGPNGWAEFSNDGLPAYGETDPWLNIFDFTVFNNELYACGGLWDGTSEQSAGGQVYKYNGTAWEQVGTNREQSSNAIAVYNNELYWGTHWSGDLFKYDNTSSDWLYTGKSFGMSVTDLVVANDKLYIGSWNTSYETGALDEFDGTNWTKRYTGEGVTELAAHDTTIYWGTNPGGKIFSLSNTDVPWVVNVYDLDISAVSGLVSLGGDLYNGGTIQSNDTDLRDNFIYKNGVKEAKLQCCYLISSGYSSPEIDVWVNLVWNSSEPEGTGIEFWVEGKEPGEEWGAAFGDQWSKVGFDKPLGIDGSDMRYKVYLWSITEDVTPTLYDVSFKVKD
jgi:hypothetical protein